MMTISQLVSRIGGATVVGCDDAMHSEVKGLCYDSRKAGPGMLFAALRGEAVDGHLFVDKARQAGALAALVEQPQKGQAPFCQIKAANSRAALSRAAHEFFGRPSLSMTCVGATGTNGKTTVIHLVEAALRARGEVGVMGTIEVRFAGKARPADMTTPESVDVHKNLADMLAAGVNQAAMEASSHALSQHRVDDVAFDVCVFTNLSRDHLDYHGNLDDYFQAKKRLFTEILPRSRKKGKPGLAVVCVDQEPGRELAEMIKQAGGPLITYGFTDKADLAASGKKLSLEGGSCMAAWQGQSFDISTPMVGEYNLSNLLAAYAVCLGLGMSPKQIGSALEGFSGVPGRLEQAPCPLGFNVFVDYAHTDNALENVLAALKPLTRGRLICVFGAGGDRDHGKRPLMGSAVARGADLAILTSDNPRSEEPEAIMAMVAPGLEKQGFCRAEGFDAGSRGLYMCEPERAAAIQAAVNQALPGDVLLIAGKGHEDYQVTKEGKRHFDDREQALAAINIISGEVHHANA